MTTETITIVVNEKGARVVKRSIEDIGAGAEKANKGVGLLTKALGAIGVAVAARELVRLVDTYTNLQNRLKLVTTSTEQLGAVTKQLFEISNSTRASYAATAEVYARTALATKELGLSQQQTLDFTKSLNQAVILSGASAQEAQAGLIQLSQGLASGTLRGDELRSVLEQLPAVADVIATQMGITRGELRELGTEGKITATNIIQAFQGAREELEEKFAKTVPTIGQAFTILRNNVIEFIGALDESTGASRAAAQLIIAVANNIGLLSRILVIATSAWVAYKVASSAAVVISTVATVLSTAKAFAQLALTVRSGAQAMALLNLVTAANPFVFIVTAITAAVAAVILFRTEILNALRSVEFFGTNIVQVMAFVVDTVVGSFAGAYAVIEGFFNKLRILLIKNADYLNTILAPLGREIDIGKIVGADVIQVMESAGRTAGENFNEGFRKSTENGFLAAELSREFTSQAPEFKVDLGESGAALQTISEISEKTKDFITDLQFEAEQLKRTSIEQEIYNNLKQGEATRDSSNGQIIEGLTREIELLQTRRDILDEIQDPQQTFYDNQLALQELYSEGLITLEEFNNKLAEQQLAFLNTVQPQNFSEGFISELKKMVLETRNATATMGQDFARIFGPGGSLSKGVGDAVAQSIVFGKSWQESIANVGKAIISQIISSLVQIGVNMLINAVLGKTLMAASVAASAAAGSATAAAWAPAAALASLASFGANAGPAIAGMTSTVAAASALGAAGGGLPGFKDGGYTGNVGTSQVAGVVHGQEYVMNAGATAKNRSTLEAMNRGERVDNSSSGVNVFISNEIPGAQFEARQISETDVEIIARRIVAEDAPGVIAGDLSDPNSKTSKSMGQNTYSQRRRT